MVIVKFCLGCLGCLVCSAVPGARQRDSSDEPFFCDRSEAEVVYQVVDLG